MTSAERSREHLVLFDRIDDEARTAYCLGDIKLADILGDVSELSVSTRHRLKKLLKRWGEEQGLYERD